MVRQWQTLFYNHHYSATNLLDGENMSDIVDVPDFVKLAEAYGCVGMRAFTKDEAIECIKKANEINDRADRLPRVEGRHGVADGRSRRLQRQRHLHARCQASAARRRERVNE